MSDQSGFQVADDAAEAYDRHVRVFMEPLVEAMLDMAEVAEGANLLDVACGTGFVTRAAAKRVGSGGSVDAIDINAGMLAVAQRRTLPKVPVTLHNASAQELPFADGSFDVIVCQQGVQFFPDLRGAIYEMGRVARPGAVVAVTAWTPMEDSPYMHAVYAAMSHVLGAEVMASYLAAFGLRAEAIATAFAAAGLRDVRSDVIEADVSLPRLNTYLPAQLSATPWGPIFAAADEGARKTIIRRVRDMLLEDTIDGCPQVPFRSHIVLGTR